jgi:hypothetical protein
MTTDNRDDRNSGSADERDGSLPLLRAWWSDLSLAGKVLIPTTALVLVIVTGNALPSFIL